MTTKRIYTCNLCRNETREGEGVGVKWTSRAAFEFTVPANSENHLCQKCIDGVRGAVADLNRIDEARSQCTADRSAP